MPVYVPPRNPYIAGKALNDERNFFGRAEIFRLVATALASPANNALVLFGQRRIGKTSILLQLHHHLPSPAFCPIYFDLMDRARKPLSTVLYELAATVAHACGLPPPDATDFAQSDAFHTKFLPSFYQRLEAQTRPVLLFDEFDVLDVAAEKQLPATAAAREFFPYLRHLMEHEPRLAFVFVVGRKAEDLSIDVKATFKAARYQRISVLDEESAHDLVRLAEREGSVRFAEHSVDRVLQYTGRHPFFMQLLCQLLFDQAYAVSPVAIPTIDVAAVEAIIPKVLEAGENVFEWIWDGLPPAERIIFSAVAGVTDEHTAMSEEDLLSLLQGHGIRILIRELELAPQTLIAWEMLRRVDGGYGFFIELIRRWVAEHKPLPKVKDELDRVDPIANQHYQLGYTYYRQADLVATVSQLQAALGLNPNHLNARVLLGDTFRELGRYAEAVEQLEEAYRYDATVARYPLIRALLAYGEDVEKAEHEEDALQLYERVLTISSREAVAREHVERIQALRRKRDLAALDAKVQTLVQGQKWDDAAEVYGRLHVLEPDNARWSDGLAQVEKERDLARRYAEGLGALQQHKWSEAQRAFADVVYVRPAYMQAAVLLVRANRQGHTPRVPRATRLRGRLMTVLAGHTQSVTSVAFSADGTLLASGSEDKSVRVRKTQDGTLVWVFPKHAVSVTSVAFSPDGGRLASDGGGQTVVVWKTKEGTLAGRFSGHAGWAWSVAFSPDGRLLASGSSDQSVRVWQIQDSTLVRPLFGHTGEVRSVAFSPDGRLLASGSDDQSVRVWQTQGGKLVRTLSGHTGFVRSVAFSPDGRLLASGSVDQTVRVWRTQDGRPVRTFSGHTDWVRSVAFSPDGGLLASGSDDKTVRVWQTQDGKLVRTFSGHTGYVLSVAFSPDGRLLASGSTDQTVRLWTVEP